MKSSSFRLLICILSVTIVGCDPVYDVDYEVWNTSGQSITIFIDDMGLKVDTNNISDNTRLVFLNVSSICCTTNEFLDGQNMLPVGISIINSNGINFNKNTADINNWDKLYPDKPDGTGNIQLRVRPDNF